MGYDSAKKEIADLKQLIKDSANRKTTVIVGESPNVEFDYVNGIKVVYKRNDTLRFFITLHSYSAGSIINNMTAYVMFSDNKIGGIFKDIYSFDKEMFLKNISLPKDGIYKRGSTLFLEGLATKSIIILLTGSFTDSYGKNMKKISEVGFLDIETDTFSMLSSPYDDLIKDFLKKKGLLE